MCEAEIDYINELFASLPVNDNPLFIELWNNSRLDYTESSKVDIIDTQVAKLIFTGTEKRQSCLFALNDDQPHRPAMLFGTALIQCAINCIEEEKENQYVLYFGNSLDIKYSLSKTVVGKLKLDTVFSSTHASGKFDRYKDYKRVDTMAENLPEVVCVINPNSPEDYIQIYKPKWIAIDCGKSNRIDWLQRLVTYCVKKSILIFAWSQTASESIIEIFEQNKLNIFFSPDCNKVVEEENFGSLFFDREQSIITPLVFSQSSVGIIDELLIKSKSILRSIYVNDVHQIKSDAVKTAWQYLNAIERLTIPVAIYNEEAKAFHFVYSFKALESALNQYIEIISKFDRSLSQKLSDFQYNINAILRIFEKSTPPYWTALSTFCLEGSPSNQLKTFIFPKRHQKQIFLYTLLSKYNISESELLDNNCIIRTLKEFTAPSKEDQAIYIGYRRIVPIIIGFPDIFGRSFFLQIIKKWDTQILLYPHQIGYLKAVLHNYNNNEQSQLNKSLQTLKIFSEDSRSINLTKLPEGYTISDKIVELSIESDQVKRETSTNLKGLLNIGSFEVEISQLFKEDKYEEYDDESSNILGDIDLSSQSGSGDSGSDSVFIETAIKIIFRDQYYVLLAPDNEMNVLKNGKIDKIFVKALRKGDKVLLIENQAKRSFYDLILSRVHNHPSLEIHLGLLKKWKEEFYLGFTIWKGSQSGNFLRAFLNLIQLKGSTIITELTINNWVNGYVMCPLDPLDLYRIGDILKVKFLIDNYQKIHNAASRIAGIHRGLSRKLNSWIENKTSNLLKDDLEVIDNELGLTFGELRSSIRILEVVEIQGLKGTILKSALGKLYTA